MAYVPGFEHDLFFSYAQDDSPEWVRALEQSLRQDLIDRLGGHHVVEFQVDGEIDRKPLTDFQGDGSGPWGALPGVESVRHEEDRVYLNVDEPHLTIPALLEAIDRQGRQLNHLSTRQASLEDVFVQLTGRHLRED